MEGARIFTASSPRQVGPYMVLVWGGRNACDDRLREAISFRKRKKKKQKTGKKEKRVSPRGGGGRKTTQDKTVTRRIATLRSDSAEPSPRYRSAEHFREHLQPRSRFARNMLIMHDTQTRYEPLPSPPAIEVIAAHVMQPTIPVYIGGLVHWVCSSPFVIHTYFSARVQCTLADRR